MTTRKRVAGAEAELATKYGPARTNYEAEVLGIGIFPEEVLANPRGKYLVFADELGILGRQLACTANALLMVVTTCIAIERCEREVAHMR